MLCNLYNFKKVTNFAPLNAKTNKIIKIEHNETYIPTFKQKES